MRVRNTPINGAARHDAQEWAREKLAQMTLEEKVLLLTGQDMWRTNPIKRLGISRIKTSDGPVGVRGGTFVDGISAASLPTGVSLAATWDLQLLQSLCDIIITEAKSKEVDVILGPTVCIPRTPLGGRNFESYSEDPFLTGKLASTFINSIQAHGIGACIKHYAANDQETRRFFVDARIPPRALREIHLQPFQIAIRDSNPWTLMTAYNKVNGTFSSANEFLLQHVLRNEWKWDGVAVSDWFGTNSVVPSVKAGLDLEMPGPVRRRGKHLLDAHAQGLIDVKYIDESATRILELIHKTGKHKYDNWKEGQEKASDLPEHRALLRQAGAEGIVLLKNEAETLPLKDLGGKKIAIIGPNAARSVASGGGSSNLVPHYQTTPYDSIKDEIAKKWPDARVSTHAGVPAHRYLPLLDKDVMKNPGTGGSGFQLSLWRNLTFEGEPFMVENRPSSNLVCYDGLPPELTCGERYCYRGRTTIIPKTTGIHQFSLSSCGPGKLILDGKPLIVIERHCWSPKSSLFMSYGSPEERVDVYMEAGRSYELLLESLSREPKPYEMDYLSGELEREEIQDGGRIGFLENQGDLDAFFNEAVELARSSDVTILVVGKDSEWETETSDMESMNLPGRSDDLIAAVAKASQNNNVIVVNQTGSPVAMPWLDEVPAIIQAWYQGQEQGNCIADVLLGAVNPCGKLPITFPRRLEDTASFDNYPGENDVVRYGEGIYAGYRFFDHRKIEPLFPFGAGLSYTTFEYSNVRLGSTEFGSLDDEIQVYVDVTNTGSVDGKEIVQLYVSQESPRLGRPPRELKGWAKVLVKAGETVTAEATLDKVSFSYWDDAISQWIIEGGATFHLTAARDSRHAGTVASVRTGEKTLSWVH
ncbi:hypothetical protein V2A60_008792 [Cordyceps javanica]